MAQEGRNKKRKWREEEGEDEIPEIKPKKYLRSKKKVEKIIFNNKADHYPYIDGDVL